MLRNNTSRSKLATVSILIAGFLAASSASADTSGYFKLQTMLSENENQCLEGNRLDPSSELAGAVFMDRCSQVSGQFWKAVPEANGYFRLKTLLGGEDQCLEGNRASAEAVLGGAAFIDRCQNVSGQLWKAVPEQGHHFRLKTQFQGDNKCLEGNRRAADAVFGGGAFLDDCQNVSGQLWKIEGGSLVQGVPTAAQSPNAPQTIAPAQAQANIPAHPQAAVPARAQEPMLLSLRSHNYPDRFIRHRDYNGQLTTVATDLDKKDSPFRRVSGLADGAHVSLESVNFPNFFLVAEGENVVLRQRPPNDAQFDRNATFIQMPGLADRSKLSLESYAQRGRYLRHAHSALHIHPVHDSDLARSDATFEMAAPGCTGATCNR